MNQQTRHYLNVGIASVVALGLLISSVLYLKGTLTDYSTRDLFVIFDNARGVTEGADVQMSGVRVGRVAGVNLTPDSRARLRLRVERKYEIPENSRITLYSGLLSATPIVLIEPNTGSPSLKEGAEVAGTNTTGIESVLEQSGDLMASLQRNSAQVEKLTASVQKLVSDEEMQGNLKETLRNIRETTETLPGLIQRSESQLATLSLQANTLLASMDRAVNTGGRIAHNANALTMDMRQVVRENRGALRSLIQSTDEAASGVAALTEQITLALGDEKLKTGLTTTVENLASISGRLDAVASDIQRLSGDPRMSADIQQTVTNLKETSESVRNLAERIEGIRIPGERRRGPDAGAPPAPRPDTSLLEQGLMFDTVFTPTLDRLRFDTNYTYVTRGGRAFYRLGVYDFTEGNRLNLQIGNGSGLPDGFSYRYGLFAGELGVGADMRFGQFDARLEAYDPNRLTINARAKARIAEGANALIGLESLGKDNRATIGVQIRR